MIERANPELSSALEIEGLRHRLTAAERDPQPARRATGDASLHFRELADNIDEVFFWRDTDRLQPSYVSGAFEKIWGQSCESVYDDPSSWIESIHPEDRDRVVRNFEATRISGQMQAEYRIVRPDAEVRWIWTRTFPIHNEAGEVRRVVGIAQDFTERNRAEETRAFLASIVESSDDAIVGTLLDGTIVSWNRSAQRLFGYRAEEALGKRITALFPAGRQSEYLTTNESIKREQHVERYESVRVRKDGTEFDVSIIVSPIQDAHGQIRGFSGLYRDITDRKRADAELLKAKEAAEAANRAKSEFLANMSHEIRTPMNGILGLTEIVLDTKLNADQRDCLGLVRSSAESLLAIINDILDVSKIEAGKLVLQVCEFWPRDLTVAILKGLTTRAEEKGLRLSWSVRPEVPEVLLGDAGRLRQILINLVGNAIKFTNAGEIEVIVETCPGRAASLHFIVRDTGIGIPAHKQTMIFDLFTQVDGSPTRKFGGMGLGLPIAARLVEMMGGQIWVESEGHSGSTFHFTVRLESPADLPPEIA